jgi:tellurite resistance protein TehA-like permease
VSATGPAPPPTRRRYLGAFAAVMAAGIASTAAERAAPAVSWLLLVVAAAAFLALSARAALVLRTRPAVLAAELRALPRGFEALTVVAAAAVLSVRLHAAGDDLAALAAGIIAAATWLALIPALARTVVRHGRPFDAAVSGCWLLAAVATESVATVAAVAAQSEDARPLALLAFAAWAAGLVAYLGLIGPVARRLAHLTRRRRFTPDLWIAMGALAISTLAAAVLLRAPHIPARSFVEAAGAATCLAAAAWIPPLAAIDARAARTRPRPGPAERWSMVFPLAMFSASAQLYGRAAARPALVRLGDWTLWVALAAWLAVAAATAAGAARTGRRPPAVAGATGRSPRRPSPARSPAGPRRSRSQPPGRRGPRPRRPPC